MKKLNQIIKKSPRALHSRWKCGGDNLDEKHKFVITKYSINENGSNDNGELIITFTILDKNRSLKDYMEIYEKINQCCSL